MSDEANKIKKLADDIEAVVKRAPRAIGSIVVRHFRENFTKQGFDDVTVRKWKARKKERKKDVGRAIMVQSGRLQKSPRLIRATSEEVAAGSDAPYAQIHNEGGIIHRRPHGRKMGLSHVRTRNEKKRQVKRSDFKMPQRQFMGASQSLNNKIGTYYTKELERVVKSIK